jgi:hypothetical protein
MKLWVMIVGILLLSGCHGTALHAISRDGAESWCLVGSWD